MKISKRDKRVLVIGVVFCAAVFLALYVVMPFLDSSARIETDLQQAEQRLQQSISMIQRESRYRAERQELEQILEQFRAQLLDAQDSNMARVQLQAIVRELAEENGVTISRSNPMQERKIGENYAEITLQINLQGGMQELTNFLYALSIHSKFLKVGQFRINMFRSRNSVRMQPQMHVTGFIKLSEA